MLVRPNGGVIWAPRYGLARDARRRARRTAGVAAPEREDGGYEPPAPALLKAFGHISHIK